MSKTCTTTGNITTPSKTKTAKRVIGAIVTAALIGAAVSQGKGHKVDTSFASQAMATQGTAWNSTSNNWSGYAETSAQTGQHFTQASAEWVVPSVTTMTSNSGVGCAALWTGIGGATTKDLIQLGTDSCANSSQTGYFAWYEILPAAGTPIQALHVQPGDKVFASLKLVSGATSASTSESSSAYQVVVNLLKKYDPSFGSSDMIQRLRQLLDNGVSTIEHESWWPEVSVELHKLFGGTAPSAPTTGSTSGQLWKLSFQITSPSGSVQTWSKTLSYNSSQSSAEWITEAPTSSAGVEPLPNYGIAHFLGIEANGGAPGFSPSNQILLGDPHGEASVPSAPVAPVDAFNTCYFPTFHVSACPNPQ